jgi:hypothetical protein
MPKLTRVAVETWIKTIATGDFHYKQVLDGKVDQASYDKLRKIMYDLCHAPEPVCETVGRRDGWYRPIQDNLCPIDFSDTEQRKDFPVILPFDLRKYVFIYPKTVIVVAGSKSSGKTGFLYRTVALNMKNVHTVLLSNMEGGKGAMLDRFLSMGIDLVTAPLKVYELHDNFHDAIREENTLYIIDYIDAPDGKDFFLIGAQVSKIMKKLPDSSVAAIGLQKPTYRDTAFGHEQTLKDATLYLAMDSNKLKIVDAKVPANDKIHPKNMTFTFQYDDRGTDFKNIQRDGMFVEEQEEIPF